jgi:hypothetical protein
MEGTIMEKSEKQYVWMDGKMVEKEKAVVPIKAGPCSGCGTTWFVSRTLAKH